MSAEAGAPAAPWNPLRDRAVWAILLVYLVLAITYNFTMALGYAPDEQSRHYPYVRFLATEWTLPVGDEGTEGGYLDIHPPLYYALLTPVYLIFHPQGDYVTLRALRLTWPTADLPGPAAVATGHRQSLRPPPRPNPLRLRAHRLVAAPVRAGRGAEQ